MTKIAKLHHITQDLPGISHRDQAEESCAAGCKWVQLRCKNMDEEQWLKTALEVQQVCKRYGAVFIVNDAVWLAKEVKADGVHLGLNDTSIAEAKKNLRKNTIIGATANTLEDILRLSSEAPDYFGLGPFRYTETKKVLSPVLGIEGYKEIVGECIRLGVECPIVAIGGITPKDLPTIFSVGVWGVAVSSAINQSKDMRAATRTFLDII